MLLGCLSLEKSGQVTSCIKEFTWLSYARFDSKMTAVQREVYEEITWMEMSLWSIVLDKQLKLKAAVHKTTKLINLAHATKQSQPSYAVLFLALKRSILEHLWNSFFFRRNERNILVKLLQEFTRVKTSFIELLKLQYETVNKARQQKLYKRTKI